MTESVSQPQESLLYSYRIASGDMKFIEINTREIYLRRDPESGLVLRGEIPGCGASCHATLSRVFLEYAMSCRGLEDSSEVLETVTQFGEQLGEQLAASFSVNNQIKSAHDPVTAIFECITTSLEGQAMKEVTADGLIFTFSENPLAATAMRYGHQRWLSPAYQGLVVFFEHILKSVGGGWTLFAPNADDGGENLQVIHLQKQN